MAYNKQLMYINAKFPTSGDLFGLAMAHLNTGGDEPISDEEALEFVESFYERTDLIMAMYARTRGVSMQTTLRFNLCERDLAGSGKENQKDWEHTLDQLKEARQSNGIDDLLIGALKSEGVLRGKNSSKTHPLKRMVKGELCDYQTPTYVMDLDEPQGFPSKEQRIQVNLDCSRFEKLDLGEVDIWGGNFRNKRNERRYQLVPIQRQNSDQMTWALIVANLPAWEMTDGNAIVQNPNEAWVAVIYSMSFKLIVKVALLASEQVKEANADLYNGIQRRFVNTHELVEGEYFPEESSSADEEDGEEEIQPQPKKRAKKRAKKPRPEVTAATSEEESDAHVSNGKSVVGTNLGEELASALAAATQEASIEAE